MGVIVLFYDRFIELCKEKGVKPSVVAKEIGLSNAAPTYWKNGSTPKSSTIQAIADYFGVTVGYLLGGEKIRIVPLFEGVGGISNDDIKFALFGGNSEVTDEMLNEVRAFAAFVAQREADKKKKADEQK